MPRRSSKQKPEVVVAETGVPRMWIVLGAAALLAVLFIAGVGPSLLVPVYRIVVDGTILLIWLAAMLGIGAWVLRMFSITDFPAPITTAAALGIGITSLACCELALAGLLNRATAWGLLAIGGIAGIVWLNRWRRNHEFSIAAWFGKKISAQKWLWLLAIPFLAIALVGALVPPGALWGQGEPNGYDVVEYHLQVPREWFDAGRMIPLHHNVFSFFPFNVETHYLLAMHLRGGPYAGMYLAQFMHLAMVALSVAALFELLGGQSMLAVLFAAATPWLAMLGSIAYDEGGVLLFGTLAVGWMLNSLSQHTLQKRRIAMAGLMAGLACGCKWSCVPMLLGILPMAWLLCVTFRRRFFAAIKPLAMFGLLAVIALSPWLLRNWRWTGNPVFPEAMNVLGKGYFSAGQVLRWQQAYLPPVGQRDVVHRVAALGPQIFMDWRFGFLLFPATAMAIVGALRQRGQFDMPLCFLLTLTVGWLIFWIGFTHLQGRFLVLLIPIASMLIARVHQPIGRLVILCGLLLQVGLALLNFADPIESILIKLQPVLGVEDYSWLGIKAEQAAKATGDVCLIGDAKAFFYELPSSRLHYRTVFDVNVDNRDVVDDWGDGCPNKPGTLVFVDFGELERFHRTYGTPLPRVMPTTSASEKP